MSVSVFHRRLLLSSTILVGALTGYAGRAYAQCAPAGGSAYECSGATTTAQVINANDASVSTLPGFSVDTTIATGSAITIIGDGALSYTDANSSPLVAQSYGINIEANGSITIDTNGAVNSNDLGIRALNIGSGAVNITANGDVTSTTGAGVGALTHGTDMTITTGAAVAGVNFGIIGRNGGDGALTITANGDVTASAIDGIFALNMLSEPGVPGVGTDLTVTTGAGATVIGHEQGIEAENFGSGNGALTITANSDVTGTTLQGIRALNANTGTDLTITTGAGAAVIGGTLGIEARNYGSGALSITANGDVTGGTGDGIYALHAAGGPVAVTVGALGAVTSNGADADDFAIDIQGGPGAVTIAGAVNGGAGAAIVFDQANPFANRLELHPTAVINGNVFGGSGSDTLAFGGAGNGAFDLAAIDTGANTQQYRSFESFEVNSGAWSFTGATTLGFTVTGGIMQVQGVTGAINVLAGGRLQGVGAVGGANNAGTIAPGNSIGTLTVDGDYAGNGGLLEIETELGGDASPTDLLVVTGATSGATDVRVINVGGAGAATVEGIKIIDIGGASNGDFTLLGDYQLNGQQVVVAGAYGYALQKNGVSTPADGDWYLRSALLPTPPAPGPDPDPGPGPGPGPNPDPDPGPGPEPGPNPGPDPQPEPPAFQVGVPIYEAYAQALQGFNALGTLQQRAGNRIWGEGAAEGEGAWLRFDTLQANHEPEGSTTGAHQDMETWRLQVGADARLHEGSGGEVIGSLFAQYGVIGSEIDSVYGDGKITGDGFGLGGALTWYASNGVYVDGQAQATWYESELNSRVAGELADGLGGSGYGLSIEAGKQIALGGALSLTPQAQLSYAQVDFDDFADPFGADVSLARSEALQGRLGLSLDHRREWTRQDGLPAQSHIYGIANLYYAVDAENEVDVAGTRIFNDPDQLWGGLGVGGSYNVSGGKHALFAEGAVNTSLENFGDSHSVTGTIGWRTAW
jgi:fibronectin-binding autotransporter adhesin